MTVKQFLFDVTKDKEGNRELENAYNLERS